MIEIERSRRLEKLRLIFSLSPSLLPGQCRRVEEIAETAIAPRQPVPLVFVRART